MDSSKQPSLLDTIWRQRWLVIGCMVLAAVAAGVISRSLPKVYSTSSKLLIVQSEQARSFDAIQAAQVTARTYSDVLSSPNIARLVAERLGGGTTSGEVDRAISIQPIPETQLLEIRAEAGSPGRAKALADSYGQVFIEYARTRLAPTAGATVTLADPAPISGSPSKPKPTLYVMLACLLAFPLSIGLALLRDRLDSRLRSVEELEERLGVPVLARAPRRGSDEQSIAAFDEAFRILRTSLHFASPEGGARSIAITSSWEAEGKTTTTLNLAAAAVEAGQRVLLVEADVYRANLIKRLDTMALEPGHMGLTHYLAGAADLDEIIHPSSLPGLSVVPAGPLPPSFTGLLESTRGRTLVADFTEWADLVLFDCPPLGPRADASIVAARTEAVLLVVDLRVATEHRLDHAVRQLTSVNALLIGAVVNRDVLLKPAEYGYHGDEGHLASAERS